MGTIKIENEHSLKEAFRSGVNLFVGAGFSVEAKNKKGDKLPLGKNLALELCEKFDKRQVKTCQGFPHYWRRRTGLIFINFLLKNSQLQNSPNIIMP